MKKTLLFLTLISTQWAFALPIGQYRLEMTTQYAKIPFMIKVDGPKKTYELLNGKETIKLVNLGSKKKGHTSLEIPPYSVQLSLDYSKQSITGLFINANGKQYPVSGQAQESIFRETKIRSVDLNGRWEVIDDKKNKNVLLFEQVGNKISGSYLTKYGDYRYFSGVVSGNTFNASSFDGVYNYLLTGSLEGDSLKAQILANYKIELTGKRNPSAGLDDPTKLTSMTKAVEFNFPNLDGKMLSLKDPELKGKPIILQIFGSWCPNCIDELNYLVPWYKENQKRGIRIIAISFERAGDLQKSQMILKKIAKRYDLNYPMLIAGVSSNDTPDNKLPGIKDFMAFPTTIFLDKNHKVFKVHTGFTGPSTGEFYYNWIKDFNKTVDQLLN